MAEDAKNINRVDLNEIYVAVQRKSLYAIKALGDLERFHTEDYAIQETDFEVVHEFAMEGMALLANDTHRIKYFTQTGMDALTNYSDLENPTEASSYSDPDTETADDETITDPDGATIKVVDISGAQFTSGEKLPFTDGDTNVHDTIKFILEAFPDPTQETPTERIVRRYTAIQQFIKNAIENYILYKWFQLHSLLELSNINEREYEKLKEKIRHNTQSIHTYKDTTIPQTNFYG